MTRLPTWELCVASCLVQRLDSPREYAGVYNAREVEGCSVDPAIRQAVTWSTLCLAVVMAVFTWVDISEVTTSTAMWLNAVAWPVVALLTGWIIRKNTYNSPDRED